MSVGKRNVGWKKKLLVRIFCRLKFVCQLEKNCSLEKKISVGKKFLSVGSCFCQLDLFCRLEKNVSSVGQKICWLAKKIVL